MRILLVSFVVLVSLVAVAVAQRAYQVPRLPDRVAAHIGPSGEVDRWQGKAEYVSESGQGWRVPASIFVGVTILSVLGVRFLPYPLMNLPYKDYWLASPRRRSEAAKIVLSFNLWFLATLVVVWVALTEMFFRASFTGRDPVGFGLTLTFVMGIIIAIAAQITCLIVRLSRERAAPRRRRSNRSSEPCSHSTSKN